MFLHQARVTRKAITAKEAKIEREAFESIFGNGAESYDKPLGSPVKTGITPAPTPEISEDEPEIGLEEGELVIALKPEPPADKVQIKILKIL